MYTYTKRLWVAILLYTVIVLLVVGFACLRVMHLYYQYRDMQYMASAQQTKIVHYQEEMAHLQHMISLMKENNAFVKEEYDKQVEIYARKQADLEEKLGFLGRKNAYCMTQLRRAHKASMPRYQLLVSRALLDEKMQNLIKKTKAVTHSKGVKL